jgi:hypothetical protein
MNVTDAIARSKRYDVIFDLLDRIKARGRQYFNSLYSSVLTATLTFGRSGLFEILVGRYGLTDDARQRDGIIRTAIRQDDVETLEFLHDNYHDLFTSHDTGRALHRKIDYLDLAYMLASANAARYLFTAVQPRSEDEFRIYMDGIPENTNPRTKIELLELLLENDPPNIREIGDKLSRIRLE